ncbi:MAG TPA: family 20 glycosylhydrolase [Candidatus Angelobacter sp.]|nr:family 20 glycosylhydrolase [Candidatus Angelobacter sp.]
MLPLMPIPASVQYGSGSFPIDQSLRVSIQGSGDSRVPHAVDRFFKNLASRTGIALRNTIDGSKSNFIVTCAAAGEKVQILKEDESYRLEITSSAVRLHAPNPLGILHGLQTFLQLVRIGPNGFAVPAVTIEDRPRFPWRGLLIDVSRHFMPLNVIQRNLDAMEAVKLNVLHWHLSDDQGFRVESRKYPKFQELSSDGMYYTQQQIQDIIQYARDRGIRVVPEFDVPGHSTSWFVAYPELASGPGPYQIERKWGIFDPAMDPTRDHTYHFLDGFMEEMAKLFPDQYFHIGGDEVNGKEWDRNSAIQEFKQKHGIKDNSELQTYFNQKLQKIVNKHHKVMIGWDEILHPDLPKDAVVQSWRGQASLADATRQGYRGLLSHGYYLDLMQPASLHYSVDPLGEAAANLTAEEKQRILGGEACMWAEFITPANIDERIWPRAAAIAERLWSPENIRDPNSMYARLQSVSDYLDFLGLMHNASYRLMLERLSGSADTRSLQVLADVVEPVKEYARGDARQYDSFTPLNRLVDTVHPESDAARKFAEMVQRVLNNPSATADVDAVQRWLSLWRDNDRQLEPLLQANSLLQEIIPLSQNLQSVATAGLQAIEYLAHGGHAPGNWRDQQLAMLKQAEKPQAELLNMVVPAVEKLVSATVPQ